MQYNIRGITVPLPMLITIEACNYLKLCKNNFTLQVFLLTLLFTLSVNYFNLSCQLISKSPSALDTNYRVL